MNDKKSIYYIQAIFKVIFNTDNTLTINQISQQIGLSEKTVRLKIDNINVFLSENNLGEIVKKRRTGVWLNCTNEQKMEINRCVLNNELMEHLQNDNSRMYIALKYILTYSKHNKVTTSKLAQEMYLSIPTTLKIITDCKEWLKLFNINLKVVRNKGFELDCDESQYRIALKHFVLKLVSDDPIDTRLNYFMPGTDFNQLKKFILNTEKQWDISFAEESFNEIYVFLCICISRVLASSKNNVIIPENELRMLQTYNEYRFSETLLKKANEHLNLKIDAHEIGFLSIPILCSKMIDPGYNVSTADIITQYDNKLREFVSVIISVVSEVLNVDLSNDETLFYGLLLHLKPAIFRLRYERPQSNKLKRYIKTEFKNAFRVSWLISVLFEEHFNLTVTEDELSYITLYIQSALERNEKPVKALLVTRTSMGVNQMLADKITRNFTQIQCIKVVSVHDFKIDNYKDMDLILTTDSLKLNIKKIIEIDDLLSESSIKTIKTAIRDVNTNKNLVLNNFNSICHSLFEPGLIFTNLDIDNKQDILKYMCNGLVEKGYVTKKYLKTVLDREKATSTSIGNMVAIPHGDQVEINEAKVVIATLKNPIKWDEDDVDVIFLLVVKMTNEFEIQKTQQFYKQYINIVSTDVDINLLRMFDNSIDFYKFLVK